MQPYDFECVARSGKLRLIRGDLPGANGDKLLSIHYDDREDQTECDGRYDGRYDELFLGMFLTNAPFETVAEFEELAKNQSPKPLPFDHTVKYKEREFSTAFPAFDTFNAAAISNRPWCFRLSRIPSPWSRNGSIYLVTMSFADISGLLEYKLRI